jgi:hypothetical protein
MSNAAFDRISLAGKVAIVTGGRVNSRTEKQQQSTCRFRAVRGRVQNWEPTNCEHVFVAS